MKDSEILHILLLDALKYRNDPAFVKAYLKEYVNNAINHSQWCDGFEIAVKVGELDHYEYTELIDSIRTGFPDIMLDKDLLIDTIDRELPSFFGMRNASWITADNFVIFSDEISIGKFQNNKFVWVSPRISLDGIKLEEITEVSIKGQYWDGDYDSEKKCDIMYPFELSLEDGSIIQSNGSDFKWFE